MVKAYSQTKFVDRRSRKTQNNSFSGNSHLENATKSLEVAYTEGHFLVCFFLFYLFDLFNTLFTVD